MPPFATSSSQDSQFPVSSAILLSVLTVPVLGGLLAGRAFMTFLQDLGQASEEIFRGDRLPVLHVSDSQLTDVAVDTELPE